MDLDDLLEDFLKILKKSKFGEHIISKIYIANGTYVNDSVNLILETNESIEKELKGKSKGYVFLFKKITNEINKLHIRNKTIFTTRLGSY